MKKKPKFRVVRGSSPSEFQILARTEKHLKDYMWFAVNLRQKLVSVAHQTEGDVSESDWISHLESLQHALNHLKAVNWKNTVQNKHTKK